MSSTRHAPPGSPLKQNRYASSPELETGLLANMVAKRCTVLPRPEDRELIWFVQSLSHQDGGLKRFAAELCELYAPRLATPAMQRLGAKPGQLYNARQVEQVRAEIPGGEFAYLLQGEDDLLTFLGNPSSPADPMDRYTGEWEREQQAAAAKRKDAAEKRPNTYAASIFSGLCRTAASDSLERHLTELCLDPAKPLAAGAPWFFPSLVSTLREYMAEWITRQQPRAVTSIGRNVCDALDYALESGRLVLIDGMARTGKTFAAKAWVAQHPGRARYVQVPSSKDEIGFFRAIASALGVSCGLSWKAVQLRDRIEDALKASKLMLVFDEAHYLFPTTDCRYSLPGRINWVMTALINQGVPVALVTTPQFIRTQKVVEARTNWTSEQFIGRIGHYQPLPDTLSADDLEAVAKTYVPQGDAKSIKALVLYAESSAKYLAGIEAVACRAQYIAGKEGRTATEYGDIKRAIQESVIPSDRAFASAMQPTPRARRSQPVKAFSAPLQARFTEPETGVQTPFSGREISPGGQRNRVAELDAVPG
ncbi:MAG: ATP-binding protein [Verrucomicrobiota bacterium]